MHIEQSISSTITRLNTSDLQEAAQMLARSMASNPLHLAIFKNTNPPALRKQEKMFSFVLRMPHNEMFVAKDNGKIVGVMCYCSSEYCKMSFLNKLISISKMLPALGSSLLPVLKWRMNWETHDYRQPHLHFGPLAVDPAYRNRGIGKALLQHFCKFADSTSQAEYLETDKEENVMLYEKFGFRVVETDVLFGVQNWFMVRTVETRRR